MRSIAYPNAVEDLVVVGYRGRMKLSFTLRPVAAGCYRLLVWPRGLPDPDLFVSHTVVIPSGDGAPILVEVDLASVAASEFIPQWKWAMVRTTPEASALNDFARAAFGAESIAHGVVKQATANVGEVRTIAWSCHMPFDTSSEGSAILEQDATEILNWYAREVASFDPHVIWAGGDTAYSDGTESVDFSNQVYERGGWHLNPENREWLRSEYRRMYQHYWSLPAMRRTLGAYPHLFIWDDHEIHDGWGSEAIHRRPGNREMFSIAQSVASEYILNAGPRIRPDGAEAHQAYVLGSMAAFIFDTRSTRDYVAPSDRLISREQYDDFVAFLDVIADLPQLRDLVTQTTVPFVGINEWVTSSVTKAPNLLNDNLLQGVRDDLRDSWSSPGNIDTLRAVLDVLVRFMHQRPDVRVTNVSGDIHVAQAYAIDVPNAPTSIIQVTSSAITNRHHPPDAIAELIEVADETSVDGIGQIRRLWPTVTDPNYVEIRATPTTSEFRLRVWRASQQEPSLAIVR